MPAEVKMYGADHVFKPLTNHKHFEMIDVNLEKSLGINNLASYFTNYERISIFICITSQFSLHNFQKPFSFHHMALAIKTQAEISEHI